MLDSNTLYITGAGVSAESGIPTFRGADGYWTVGSKHYTPQQMATRQMYQQYPIAFLSWYFHRFISYRHHKPNAVHQFLVNKPLITQNIDTLDAKAGHKHYLPIHGRIDEVTQFAPIDAMPEIITAPWDLIDESKLEESLREVFKIPQNNQPQLQYSLKPRVLLFDEYYTELYQLSAAQELLWQAKHMVFMGTSFSVGFTQMAIDIARQQAIPITVVDPQPVQVDYANVRYEIMTANDYVQRFNTQTV